MREVMETLQKENRVVAGSRVDLARALIGVGVQAGAPSPDLSTPDTFKAALLKARSVSYVNPASGGTSDDPPAATVPPPLIQAVPTKGERCGYLTSHFIALQAVCKS